MSFATVTIIMACLIIMGSFGLLVVNINDMISGLEYENEVVAFVDDDADPGRGRGAPARWSRPCPTSPASSSSRNEQAMEDVQGGLRPRALRHPGRLRVPPQIRHPPDRHQPHEPDARPTSRHVDGIAKVNAHLDYAQAFITARNIVSVVSLILIVILIVVSFFIMSNTIKLATFTRREEIAIMKMVGASNGFIRCPFIVEGLVLGIVGGGLAFLIEWGLYNLVTGKIVTGVAGTLISVVPFSEVMLPLLGAYLAVGVLVGVVGGSSAIRNYLKV